MDKICCEGDFQKIIDVCTRYEDEFNWSPLIDGSFFDKELKKELSNEHSLYGIKVQAVARCDSCDDVLFCRDTFSSDNKNRYAIVHLTYSTRNTINYPKTIYFENLDFVLDYMVEKFQLEFL